MATQDRSRTSFELFQISKSIHESEFIKDFIKISMLTY